MPRALRFLKVWFGKNPVVKFYFLPNPAPLYHGRLTGRTRAMFHPNRCLQKEGQSSHRRDHRGHSGLARRGTRSVRWMQADTIPCVCEWREEKGRKGRKGGRESERENERREGKKRMRGGRGKRKGRWREGDVEGSNERGRETSICSLCTL